MPTREQPEARPLSLTFDDGPDPRWTPQILAALDATGMRATFFVLGEQVRRDPAMLALIADAGHAIELHGDQHLDHEVASPQEVRADTRTALATLRECGVRPTRWRLPWGRVGSDTRALARELELELVGWDHDTHDWRGDGWAAQPPEVRDGVARGGVVLLHDAIGPGATRSGCENTIDLIWAIARRRDV